MSVPLALPTLLQAEFVIQYRTSLPWADVVAVCSRYDLLPFYSRLVAILHPCMPDVATDLGTCLKGDFRWHVSRSSFWLLTQHIIVRSCEVSEVWDWMFKPIFRFKIWQAPQQHGCWDACQISERSEKLNKSGVFKTSSSTLCRSLHFYLSHFR